MTTTEAIVCDDPFANLQDDWESASRYLSMFIDEAEHTLDELIDALLALEAGGGRENVEQLFVAAHRMKGSAASIGLNRIAKLAHFMEDVLQVLVDNGRTPTPPITDAMLMCTDGLRQYVDTLKAGRPKEDQFDALARQLVAARAAFDESQGEGRGARDEGRGTRDEGRGTRDEGRGTRGETNAVGAAVELPHQLERSQQPSPSPLAPRPSPLVPSASDLHQRVAALVRETEHDTVLVGQVIFEPALPQVGLKARLIYEKLSHLGEIRYFDPPADDVEMRERLDAVSFGVATEKSPEAMGRLLRVAGIQRMTVEPLAVKPLPVETPATGRVKAHDPSLKPAETLRVDIERLDQLMNLAGQLSISKARVAQIAEKLKKVVAGETSARILGGVAAELEKMADGSTSSTTTATLRADMEHLRNTARHLHNDLDAVRREVESLAHARGCVNDLFETIHLLDRVSDGIHQSVMDTRMLPIGPLFARFHRVIRDITRANGKDIRLAISGEKTELDKRMIDELADPMIHMIRNAADHGIESPEMRVAAGKPRQGTISLDAFHRGSNIVIRVSDDGQGLDHERIRAKAVEKGLVSAADAERMTRQQIYQLIWLPGLSTAEKVTEVSGRGVGMDIVRSKIDEINGAIEIDSEPGRGATLTIKLPLTLAILPSLMVEIDGDVFAFPLESVVEIVRVQRHDMTTVHGRLTALVRDRVVSIVTLGTIFNWRHGNIKGLSQYPLVGQPPSAVLGDFAQPGAAVLHSGIGPKTDAGEAGGITLVIIGEENRQLGLAVDRVLGEEDMVIKSIADNYRNVAGIAGASILGNGRVSLILDPPTLIEMSSHPIAATAIA